MTEKKKSDKRSRTLNPKLIATLSGVASITALAVAGAISGGAALPAIIGLVAGYVGYRQLTKG